MFDQKKYRKEYYKRNKDAELKGHKEWKNANPERRHEHLTKWRERNPEKWAASILFNHAIRDGKITKGPCEVCGVDKVHGHHDDYDKPLEVRWLCPAHHADQHRLIKEEK